MKTTKKQPSCENNPEKGIIIKLSNGTIASIMQENKQTCPMCDEELDIIKNDSAKETHCWCTSCNWTGS
jgi:hypothetical protein